MVAATNARMMTSGREITRSGQRTGRDAIVHAVDTGHRLGPSGISDSNDDEEPLLVLAEHVRLAHLEIVRTQNFFAERGILPAAGRFEGRGAQVILPPLAVGGEDALAFQVVCD